MTRGFMKIGNTIVTIDVIKEQERPIWDVITNPEYATYYFHEAVVTDISPPTDIPDLRGFGELKMGTSIINYSFYRRLEYFVSEELFKLASVGNGTRKLFHSNGSLKMEEELVNGISHGTVRSWYRNGRLEYETQYINGLLHGPYNSWFSDGKSSTEAHYENGLEHGIYRSWSENWSERSKKCHSMRYEHGKSVSFHKSGGKVKK